MSKRPLFPMMTAAGLISLLGPALPAQAADPGDSSSPTIEVRDGEHRVRHFQLDDGHVVQFPGNDAPGNAQLRSASAVERKQLKSLGAGTAARGLDARDGGEVSPVLRDAGGKPWALPGGLIVTFQQAVSDDEARAQLAAAGLTPERAINPQVWLVKSPAGLASVDLANTLNEKGLFADVSPNWWTPRARK
ncbi:MAG: hypothetical protein Q4B17_07940 [Lautropia sp.]|nr:hypothetical protein [Lautropia sp.]